MKRGYMDMLFHVPTLRSIVFLFGIAPVNQDLYYYCCDDKHYCNDPDDRTLARNAPTGYGARSIWPSGYLLPQFQASLLPTEPCLRELPEQYVRSL